MIKFKILGDLLWDEDGNPRRATAEEKLLWAERIKLLAKIEELEPVPPCLHPKCRIFNKGLKNETVQCVICSEYVTPGVRSIEEKRTTSHASGCLPTT